GFREFLLRGLEKVKIEMNLACIAHNLQKIWRLSVANSC
ncbi:MAG: transposase, partial [Nanoarchaeota archaeon]|nr:transposase [Nanoarchaeota archaeon]